MASRLCLDCEGITDGGTRCEPCRLARQRARDGRRGTAAQRGYDRTHQRNRATVLAASTVCWICGHPGADQADHVVPRSRGGSAAVDNLRPSHGTEPCGTCGRRCNQERGAKPAHPE